MAVFSRNGQSFVHHQSQPALAMLLSLLLIAHLGFPVPTQDLARQRRLDALQEVGRARRPVASQGHPRQHDDDDGDAAAQDYDEDGLEGHCE